MGLALGLLAVMAGLLAASDVAAQAVREGLALCGGSVIPALFPFLVVSRLCLWPPVVQRRWGGCWPP